MIEYVRGRLAEKNVSTAVVEAGGLGYLIEIPLSTFEALPDLGKEVCLLTHHYVREDAQKLFGFASSSERDMFRLLIGISKIGPKVALSILSKVTPDELAAAVVSGDAGRLKSIPGVGPKTAQRLVLELKGNLGTIADSGVTLRSTGSVSGKTGTRDQAFDAMVTLGYSDKMVQVALERVAEVVPADLPVEEWIRKALQVI